MFLKKYVFIGISFMLLFLTVPFAHAQEVFEEKDLYERIYKDLQENSDKKVVEIFAVQFDSDYDQMWRVLIDPTAERLQNLPFCKAIEDDFGTPLACAEQLFKLFDEARAVVREEMQFYTELLAQNRWANGSLEDGSFDIIIDLNIVDQILFGLDATVFTPRLAGQLADPSYSRSRRLADLVDPLILQRGDGDDGEDTDNDGNDNDDSDDGSDGGDDDGGEDDDPDDGDTDDDPGDTGPMCIDPDALFLTSSEGDSSDIDTNDSSGSGNNNNSDTNRELPDLSGADNNYLGGTYPDLNSLLGNDAAEDDASTNPEEEDDENDADSECGEDEVGVFNGMLCVPEFCDDIVCVFIETKPGRAFTLAPQETPGCINCIIEKGTQILETMEHTVDTPQCVTNEAYSINFRSLFSGSGKNWQVQVVKKQASWLDYKTEEQTPEQRAEDQKNKAIGSSEFSNEKLARMVLGEDCDEVLSLFPSNAIIGSDEIFDICRKNRESKENYTLDSLSEIKEFQNIEQTKDFTREIQQEIQLLRANIQSFTGITTGLTEELIRGYDQQCEQ